MVDLDPLARLTEDNPLEMKPDGIPYKEPEEGLQPDGSMVVPFGDGTTSRTRSFADPDEDPDHPINHDANLVYYLSEEYPDQLSKLAKETIDFFWADVESRSDWEKIYRNGLKELGFDRMEDVRSNPFPGASNLNHPLLGEAIIEFQSRAKREIVPPDGPVKAKIVGQTTTEKRETAKRLRRHMNFMLTEEIVGYEDQMDQLLFEVALIGSVFKEVFWDTTMEMASSQTITFEDFVMPYGHKGNLYRAPRYTQILRLHEHEIDRYQEDGTWDYSFDPTPYKGSYGDSRVTMIEESVRKIEGYRTVYPEKDDRLIFIKQTRYLSLPDVEGDAKLRPYVVTIHPESQKVVDIRREWREEDLKERKIVRYVHYKLIPWKGSYGAGFLHLVGGLTKAATGAIRSLLDAAAFANLQGGFKLKSGRTNAQTINLGPGKFAEIESTTDDIRKAIMPLTFSEPSQTLYSLLGTMVEEGRRFASIADLQVGDGANTGPVGTTLALLEQGSKVYSAIHTRLHTAQKYEFKFMVELQFNYMPDEITWGPAPEDKVFRSDYDPSIVDVVPVSDPRIFSHTQRVTQAQTMAEIADKYPDKYDRNEVAAYVVELLEIPEPERFEVRPPQPVNMDPLTENMFIMRSMPVTTRATDAHEAHIAVHMHLFMTNMEKPGFKEQIAPALMAHIAEHIGWNQRIQAMQIAGIDLPAVDPRNQEEVMQYMEMLDQDPEQRAKIAEASAQAVQQMMDMLNQPGNPDALGMAQIQADKEVGLAEVERKRQKDQGDLNIKREAQQTKDQQASNENRRQDLLAALKAEGLEAAIGKSKVDTASALLDMVQKLMQPEESSSEASN